MPTSSREDFVNWLLWVAIELNGGKDRRIAS